MWPRELLALIAEASSTAKIAVVWASWLLLLPLVVQGSGGEAVEDRGHGYRRGR